MVVKKTVLQGVDSFEILNDSYASMFLIKDGALELIDTNLGSRLILEKKVESFFKHENILLTQAENGSDLNAYVGNQYIKAIPGV